MRISSRSSGGFFAPDRSYEFESSYPQSFRESSSQWRVTTTTTKQTHPNKPSKRPKGDAIRAEEV